FYIFFFISTATTEIYTLSLHDALPISDLTERLARVIKDLGSQIRIALGWKSRAHRVFEGDRIDRRVHRRTDVTDEVNLLEEPSEDRKSTRLNSSHDQISYAVFCLKKKK